MPLKLTDVPNQVLVSILIAAKDWDWVRYSFPCVCKAFRDLYRSRDASPLHKTLLLDFADEVAVTKRAATRRSPRPKPVVRASRVLSWARTHAESVRTLALNPRNGASLGSFTATDFAQLVAAVGPHLTMVVIREGFTKLLGPPFWAVLRARVIPARKLRVLEVVDIPKGFSTSDVEPLVQLRGSLEELFLWGSVSDFGNPSTGLRRFPESFLALTNLQKLSLCFQARIKAIRAGIFESQKTERTCCLLLRPSLAAQSVGRSHAARGARSSLESCSRCRARRRGFPQRAEGDEFSARASSPQLQPPPRAGVCARVELAREDLAR